MKCSSAYYNVLFENEKCVKHEHLAMFSPSAMVVLIVLGRKTGEEATSLIEFCNNNSWAVYGNELTHQLWTHVVLFIPNRYIYGVLYVFGVFLLFHTSEMYISKCLVFQELETILWFQHVQTC